MSDERKWFDGLKVLTAAGVLVAALAACDGELLDVNDPDNVEPEEQLSPANVSARTAGMINEFREAYDDYVLYAGLLTDEFILAGTFPTRREVDQRNPISQNVSINVDVWQPLSVTRAVADQNLAEFEAVLGSEEFAGVEGDLQTGIAWGNLVAGYSRLFLAEIFCHSILGGGSVEDLPRFVEDEEPEPAPLGSAERAEEALGFFQEAQARAEEFGNEQVRLAALVAQARTHMLLHSLTSEDHLTQANEAAEEVWNSNPAFVATVEFATESAAEENEVFQFTWGINNALRWTVGEGTDDSRGNEAFAYYGTIPTVENEEGEQVPDLANATGWVGQGLVIPPFIAGPQAGLAAFNGVSPVAAQTLYAGRSGSVRDISIPLATAWEARTIMAEVALRQGDPGAAEGMVNPLLTDPDQTQNPMTFVNSGLTAAPGPGDFTPNSVGEFGEVSLGDDPLPGDLADLAFAYEAGLWMTGHRLHFLRRMAQEFDDRFFPRNAAPGHFDGNDEVRVADGSLWPDHGFPNPSDDAGDAISLPVPVAEVDNNTNISNACPAGFP